MTNRVNEKMLDRKVERITNMLQDLGIKNKIGVEAQCGHWNACIMSVKKPDCIRRKLATGSKRQVFEHLQAVEEILYLIEQNRGR